MQIASSQTREKYPLSTKKVLKKTLTGVIGVFLLLGFILVILGLIVPALIGKKDELVASIFGVAFVLGIVGFVIVALLEYLYQRWYYAVYYYDLQEDSLSIKKGPILPSEITIPYVRIQDVYVDQDILDRVFGLYDVHVSSATISSGLQAHIDGVEKPAADGLRQELLEKIGKRNT